MWCCLEDMRAGVARKATARFAEMEHAVSLAPAITDGATIPSLPQTCDSSASVSLDHGEGGSGLEFEVIL